MDQQSLESSLADLHLPAVRFFNSIDSTNDEAWRWVESGARHTALVVADEQTAGRGRVQRRWISAAGGGLAFSLVLLPSPLDPNRLAPLTGLGALAACQAIHDLYTIPAEIKWPNDILVEQRKVGGVLVESRWDGKELQAVVMGIGINIAPYSISPEVLRPDTLSFPATCVELAVGHPVDKMELLHAILQQLFSWLPRLNTHEFIRAWESRLAYRGQWVDLSEGTVTTSKPTLGKVIGLTADGALQLSTRSGKVVAAQVGEIHLRPATPPEPG